MLSDKIDPANTSGDQQAGRKQGLPEIDTRTLFKDSNEVLIRHDAVTYRLRITKAGKLILTK